MGTKSKKKAKTRLDAYYRLAKDQGYRARSAFKLIQLNRKYDFLAKSRVLVDLCAAPGGWLQVAAKHMPIGSKIVGVDLAPIAPIRGCKTFVGDITDDKTRKTIVTWLKKEPVDCVIHDGAPNVGGVWSRDLFEQNALVLCAAKMATQLLKTGGWFVTKVFRSPDFQKLMWVMKQLFEKVEATKPLASRMESAEIFVVCAGFKNPKHVDPKLFHAQSVFADVKEEKIVSASGVLITPKTNVPQGYDEFATISHPVATLREFLDCKEPKSFLRMYHEIRFPESDRGHLSSKHSRKELVYLCQDLQQVGEADRRRLIRWREQLLKEEARVAKATMAAEDEDDDDEDRMAVSDNSDNEGAEGGAEGGDKEEDDVTVMARQLLEIRKKELKDLKKKQKKLVDRKLKQVKGLINYDPNQSAEHYTDVEGFGAKSGTAAIDPDAVPTGDEEGDAEYEAEIAGLGSMTISNVAAISEDRLAALMDKHWEESESKSFNDPLNPVVDANLGGDDDVDLGSSDDDDDSDSDSDSKDNDAKKKKVAAVDNRPLMINNSMQLIEGQEDECDVDAYGNYIKAERSNRVRLFEEGFGDDQQQQEEDELEPMGEDGYPLSKEEYKKQKKAQKDEQDLDEAGKQSKWQRRHMNIDKVLRATFPKPKQNRKKRDNSKLVDQDVVDLKPKGAMDLGGLEKSKKDGKQKTRYDANVSDDEDSDDYEASDVSSMDAHLSDEDVLEINEGRRDSRRKKLIVPDMGKLTATELIKQQRKQTMKDNRELRKKKTQKKGKKGKKNDTEFEEIPLALTDPDVRARTLAVATKMLDKRNRRDILDASINRFMHNDDDDLPDWFVKDEQRNCKIYLPVTAAEVEAERLRFAEMNARPSRKVAEALGRKRRKAQRMLRGMLEKGKSDPRARQKANGLSVRKLMRAQVIKGGDAKKKKKPLDAKSMGERKRTRQSLKRQGVKTGGGGNNKKRR